MENIKTKLNDATAFDKALNGSLPEAGDLTVITKDNATVEGKPAVMLTFTVQLPDNTFATAQTVTTLKLLIATLRILEGRYCGLDGDILIEVKQ